VRWSVRDLARSSVVIGPRGHHLLCCRLRGLGKEEEAYAQGGGDRAVTTMHDE
jgi:hypothetical protein